MSAQTEPHAPVAPGDILAGKFRVLEVLGAGGMGVVVAAEHLRLAERVALKFIRRETLGTDSAQVVRRFLKEAKAAAQLKGPNIARVLDLGELEDGMPYIVMEFLDGEDLHDAVKARGPMSAREAADCALQVCVGLAEAHARGIVHRDLKPRNMFRTVGLDGRPLIKLLDFGISKINEAADDETTFETAEHAILGSPAFMSPEQARCARSVDGRTDIWSLGASLYFLVSGRCPYEGRNLTEMVARMLSTPPEPLDDNLPRALRSAIEGCLQRDLELRLPSVAALARVLAPLADDHGATLVSKIAAIEAGSEAPSGVQPASQPVQWETNRGFGLPPAGAKEPATTRAPMSATVAPAGQTGTAIATAGDFRAPEVSPTASRTPPPAEASQASHHAPRWLWFGAAAVLAFTGWALVRGAPPGAPADPVSAPSGDPVPAVEQASEARALPTPSVIDATGSADAGAGGPETTAAGPANVADKHGSDNSNGDSDQAADNGSPEEAGNADARAEARGVESSAPADDRTARPTRQPSRTSRRDRPRRRRDRATPTRSSKPAPEKATATASVREKDAGTDEPPRGPKPSTRSTPDLVFDLD